MENVIYFDAILRLYNNKEEIDPVSLYKELLKQKNIEEIGGAAKIASLTSQIETAEPLEKLQELT